MTKKDEWRRGAKDARQAFELLRARWPKAFPAKSHEVRPLASAVPAIVEALGWSPQYAKGVLSVWKGREAYCRAVLAYPQRIDLNGSPTADIDEEARAHAKGRLEQIAARKEARAKQAAEQATAEASAQPEPVPEAAPEPVAATAPEPSPPPAGPEPERPRTRKLLTLGPAAKEALLKRGLGTTEVVATIQRQAR